MCSSHFHDLAVTRSSVAVGLVEEQATLLFALPALIGNELGLREVRAVCLAKSATKSSCLRVSTAVLHLHQSKSTQCCSLFQKDGTDGHWQCARKQWHRENNKQIALRFLSKEIASAAVLTNSNSSATQAAIMAALPTPPRQCIVTMRPESSMVEISSMSAKAEELSSGPARVRACACVRAQACAHVRVHFRAHSLTYRHPR